jgi:hypothetical protein
MLLMVYSLVHSASNDEVLKRATKFVGGCASSCYRNGVGPMWEW